jgi:hypothetical protein
MTPSAYRYYLELFSSSVLNMNASPRAGKTHMYDKQGVNCQNPLLRIALELYHTWGGDRRRVSETSRRRVSDMRRTPPPCVI